MKKVILMFDFGINVAVPTTEPAIHICMNFFEKAPESLFSNTNGKLGYHMKLLSDLRKEDEFFERHNQQAHSERWAQFLDACLVFSCLDAYLYQKEVSVLSRDFVATRVYFPSSNKSSNA
jgi:hypothetical protein